MDKAGKKYWDNNWKQNNELSECINPRNTKYYNYPNIKLHEYFKRCIADYRQKNNIADNNQIKLLEVGCANSQWLTYFKKEYNIQICGLDYSEVGCELIKKVLEREGVNGVIYCENLFSHPTELLESFDIVLTIGVIEHFENPSECINALKRFLKPNGILITEIPNLLGIFGVIQKMIDISCYNKHVAMNREQLISEHEKAQLSVKDCDYMVLGNFWTLNFTRIKNKWYYQPLSKVISLVTYINFYIEKNFKFKPNGFLCSIIVCTAKK